MKKILILFLLSLGVLFSCDKKMDNIFNESTDYRLQQKIDHYQELLTGTPNGWILTINTKYGGIYRLWMNFTKEGRVFMLSDMNQTAASIVTESGYRLNNIRTIILLFDTGSYLANIADPQPSVSGGEAGKGQGSDFDWYIEEEDNGMLLLSGRYNKVRATLIPATPDQVQQVVEGGLYTVHQRLKNYIKTVISPAIHIDNNTLSLNIESRKVSYQYLLDNVLISKEIDSWVDLDGLIQGKENGTIRLLEPLTVNGKNIIAFQWNENERKYEAVTDDNSIYPLYDHKQPVLPFRFGYDKEYNFIKVAKNELTGSLIDPFLSDVYDRIVDSVATLSGRKLQSFNIQCKFDQNLVKERMTLTINYTNAAGTSNYSAVYAANVERTNEGFVRFEELATTQSSPPLIDPKITLLLDYLRNNLFKTDWAPNNTPGQSSFLGGFYVVKNGQVSNDYFCGVVGKK